MPTVLPEICSKRPVPSSPSGMPLKLPAAPGYNCGKRLYQFRHESTITARSFCTVKTPWSAPGRKRRSPNGTISSPFLNTRASNPPTTGPSRYSVQRYNDEKSASGHNQKTVCVLPNEGRRSSALAVSMTSTRSTFWSTWLVPAFQISTLFLTYCLICRTESPRLNA